MVHVMLDDVIVVTDGWACHSCATTSTLMVEMWRMVILNRWWYMLKWQGLCRSWVIQVGVRQRASYQSRAVAAAATMSQKAKGGMSIVHARPCVVIHCRSACAAFSVIIWKTNAQTTFHHLYLSCYIICMISHSLCIDLTTTQRQWSCNNGMYTETVMTMSITQPLCSMTWSHHI
jgi:hypothetical protein